MIGAMVRGKPHRWHGVVESAQEWQVWFKTTASRYAELAALVAAEHPYDVPEILAMVRELAAYERSADDVASLLASGPATTPAPGARVETIRDR